MCVPLLDALAHVTQMDRARVNIDFMKALKKMNIPVNIVDGSSRILLP